MALSWAQVMQGEGRCVTVYSFIYPFIHSFICLSLFKDGSVVSCVMPCPLVMISLALYNHYVIMTMIITVLIKIVIVILITVIMILIILRMIMIIMMKTITRLTIQLRKVSIIPLYLDNSSVRINFNLVTTLAKQMLPGPLFSTSQ